MTMGAYPQTEASELCRHALSDPAYNACESLEAGIGDSRCRKLVDRVCGAERQCGTSQACDAADQLLRMETEERLANDDPGALSGTGRQCIEAMGNDFFKPCRPEAQAAERRP
jgi:hypothetical protein